MRPVFIVAILWSVAVAAWADLIMSAVPGQVGVYKVSLDESSPLKNGDIVEILHDGKPVGEARLTRCSDGTATINIKGDFKVCQLDLVVARDAVPVAAADPPAAGPPTVAPGPEPIGTSDASPTGEPATQDAGDGAKSLVSPPQVTMSKVMRSKRPVRGGTRSPSQEGQGTIPNLDYTVISYVAETGFIRAQVKIENIGTAASRPTQVLCLFTDYFGKAFSSDWSPLPALKPGEFVSTTKFAIVQEEDAPSQNWKAEVRFGEYGRASRPKALQRKTQMSRPRQMMKTDKARPTFSMPTTPPLDPP